MGYMRGMGEEVLLKRIWGGGKGESYRQQQTGRKEDTGKTSRSHWPRNMPPAMKHCVAPARSPFLGTLSQRALRIRLRGMLSRTLCLLAGAVSLL